MVNGALNELPLSASDRAVSGSYAALRNIQGRQHSCRQDRGDQFAVGHFRSPLLDEGVNAGIDERPRHFPGCADAGLGALRQPKLRKQRNRESRGHAENTAPAQAFLHCCMEAPPNLPARGADDRQTQAIAMPKSLPELRLQPFFWSSNRRRLRLTATPPRGQAA